MKKVRMGIQSTNIGFLPFYVVQIVDYSFSRKRVGIPRPLIVKSMGLFAKELMSAIIESR